MSSIPIARFEEEIHILIAERGKAYFDAHQVHDLQETNEGWSATIEGKESYHVLLEGHDVITQWHCTCPFEHGPVCKHIAAAFYAVQDQIQINIANAGGKIDQWIDEAPVEILRHLLKMEAYQNNDVRAAIYHEMKRRS
jgi:uncharacterized Zn finger protein